MRRLLTVAVTAALVLGGVTALAAPSHAAQTGVGVGAHGSPNAATSGIYVWGEDSYFAHPFRGLRHYSNEQLDPQSTRADIRFGGYDDDGGQAATFELGTLGGPPLATGASQVPVFMLASGNACSGTTWVALDDLAFDGSGAPTRLALHFNLACSNRPGNSFTVSAMIASSVGEPAHNIAPVMLRWGTVYQTPTVGVPVTIRNPSTIPLPVHSITTDTASFTVGNDACSGTTVAPGGTCTVRVRPRWSAGGTATEWGNLLVADGMSSASGHGATAVPLVATFAPLPSNTHFLVDNAFPVLPGGKVPLTADFDGNGTDDIFWFGRGLTPNALWLTLGTRHFASVPVSGEIGAFEPLVGDFDGNHRADILWYAPGSNLDPIWYDVIRGTGRNTLSINGNYQPIVGDFDADGIDDILWWAPGSAPDSIWYGRSNRTFVSRPLTINGDYQFVSGGDFNGDGRVDLLWWNPGITSHPLWLSNAQGGWTSSHTDSPAADSFPMVVNADGDAGTDILWYGAGPVADALDLSSQHYARQPLTINGDYDPLWGTYDGNNARLSDVLWWSTAATAPPDPFWSANGHGFTNRGNTAPHVNYDRYFPIAGDFQASTTWGYGEGDGIDILWASSVSYSDPRIMWWSYDVDGTSNPAPLARIQSPFVAPTAPSAPSATSSPTVAPQASLSLHGPGVCGRTHPQFLRFACTTP